MTRINKVEDLEIGDIIEQKLHHTDPRKLPLKETRWEVINTKPLLAINVADHNQSAGLDDFTAVIDRDSVILSLTTIQPGQVWEYKYNAEDFIIIIKRPLFKRGDFYWEASGEGYGDNEVYPCLLFSEAYILENYKQKKDRVLALGGLTEVE